MLYLTLEVFLNFQSIFIERDIVFESISLAVFNELDIDSYFEYRKTTMFSGKFHASSISTICVLVMYIRY